MTPNPSAGSWIQVEVYRTARDLHAAGFIDMRSVQSYDALCLEPVPAHSSAKIRALRARHKLSRAAFTSVHNTGLSTVRQWEVGDKHPSRPSLKMLNLLDEKGLEVLI